MHLLNGSKRPHSSTSPHHLRTPATTQQLDTVQLPLCSAVLCTPGFGPAALAPSALEVVVVAPASSSVACGAGVDSGLRNMSATAGLSRCMPPTSWLPNCVCWLVRRNHAGTFTHPLYHAAHAAAAPSTTSTIAIAAAAPPDSVGLPAAAVPVPAGTASTVVEVVVVVVGLVEAVFTVLVVVTAADVWATVVDATVVVLAVVVVLTASVVFDVATVVDGTIDVCLTEADDVVVFIFVAVFVFLIVVVVVGIVVVGGVGVVVSVGVTIVVAVVDVVVDDERWVVVPVEVVTLQLSHITGQFSCAAALILGSLFWQREMSWSV